MKEYKNIAGMMPAWLRETLLEQPEDVMNRVCEIRLRAGFGVALSLLGGEKLFIRRVKAGFVPGMQEVRQVLLHLCGYSVYLREEELKNGYISLEGGHRAAVCGSMAKGTAGGIKDPTSICIRIARQVKGAAESLLDFMPASGIIVGEPGSGKTTVLRDAARLLTLRDSCRNVVVVDERGEISPPLLSEEEFSGDVLCDYPKTQAIEMAMRLLTPDYIITDEVTSPSELSSLARAASCGISCLATAHGTSFSDIPLYIRENTGIFSFAAVLRGRSAPGRIREVIRL